jgi:histone acetyltransferase (RNA polymerase elongator complex component)
MIIPFFIPHAGCPHQCVFCNQKNITGRNRPVDRTSIPLTINHYLGPRVANDPVQIAFYGGSFTALPMDIQREYLAAARPFIQNGQVRSIRLSTRPDCVNRDILSLLRDYDVTTIELGIQSMDDRVLTLSGRGHTVADTVNAVGLLKGSGFAVGLQLMPGLPGDSAEGFHVTISKVIELAPDFVRLYPVLVIKGTPLEEQYRDGRYTPLSLDDSVSLCRTALMRFDEAGINVVRIGLQPTEELERPGTILAGPYHPAFRQLVESSLFLEKMRGVLKKRKDESDTVVLLVNPKDISDAIGQKRSNIGALKKEFRLNTLRIMPDPGVPVKTVKPL